ncbi:nickel pincer cofactor biosynthesis protein LarB [Tractidigestivibacter scatoligenes]|jgi:NCAIR mutase (PurE)-related protein|uniref:nickel pincer cofactor biosynthesis protein LarB n=1 Tax=Tractidigestivibacter scatoligenes TaxID=1299998 RepID=UPI002F360013
MSENGAGYDDLGFAKLDTNREKRTGFPEVVFCEGKPDAFLPKIFQHLVVVDGRALGTRASEHQAGLVKEVLPRASYDPVSRILSVAPEVPVSLVGHVAVVCAGTADTPVAEEAARVAEFFGSRVTRHYDVGVAGLHRLLDQMDREDGIRAANCVVAVAGMEGALASVVGGLVSVPVIAVPTSVGYGASFNGMAALLSMLNSCANGVATVNIDNGFGAAYLATQINRLAVGGSAS